MFPGHRRDFDPVFDRVISCRSLLDLDRHGFERVQSRDGRESLFGRLLVNQVSFCMGSGDDG